MTKWTIKLTGKSTQPQGGTGGDFRDDLDKVAASLGVSKSQLLDKNQSTLQDIKVKKAVIRKADAIDSIQFTYQVKAEDKQYEIIGHRHGGSGGNETVVVDFQSNEYLLKVKGTWDKMWGSTDMINYLEFYSYLPDYAQIYFAGGYGKTSGKNFSMSATACFTSQSNNLLFALGSYEGEMVDTEKKQLQIDKSNWENIFKEWTQDPAVVKNWWDKISPLWQKNFFNPYGNLTEEGLIKVKQKLDELQVDKELINEWNTDFLKEFDSKPLTVESLKLVKEKLNSLKAENAKLNNTVNTLNKNKEGSATEKTNLETQLRTQNDIILERNRTVSLLNDELRKRNQTIDERQDSINDLNDEKEKLIEKLKGEEDANRKLNNQLTEKENELQKKNDELKTEKGKAKDFDRLMEEERDRIKVELDTFYKQTLGIDDDPLKIEYGESFDSETIVDKELTLENRERMKKAFKVVACICATKDIEKEKEKFKDNPKQEKLQEALKKAIKGWKIVKKYQLIEEEKNPFYLGIINNQEEYKKKIEELKKDIMSEEDLMNEDYSISLQLQPPKNE